jgi:hypothetical protein
MKHVKVFVLLIAVLGLIVVKWPIAPRAELNDARACLRPWLDGLEAINKMDPQSPRTKQYREILDNASFVHPSVRDEEPVFYVISAVPDPSKLSVGVLPICDEANLPDVWKKVLGSVGSLAFHARFGDLELLILRTQIQVPNLIRGLVVSHEMRHVEQSLAIAAGQAVRPDSEHYYELDAYEFEFEVLDRLNLPGYNSFIQDEVRRIRDDVKTMGRAVPNGADPRLAEIFPGLGQSSEERETVAALLLVRAAFKFYEIENDHEGKMGFMQKLSYR